MRNETIKTENGNEYTFTRIDNDVNGNPRYIVHWLDLGLNSYQATDTTRRAGLSKYRGKSYGGGFVFQSHNIQHEASWLESLGLYRK